MILLHGGGTEIIPVPVIRKTRGPLLKSTSGTDPNGGLIEGSSTKAGNTTVLTGGVTIIKGRGWSADFPMATGQYGLEVVRTLFTTAYITGVPRPVMWL